MRSEEEIKKALYAVIDQGVTDENASVENDLVMIEAINELLTLRRRLDREAFGKKIYEVTLKYDPDMIDELWAAETKTFREERRKEADAIIKYLMEGTDGE